MGGTNKIKVYNKYIRRNDQLPKSQLAQNPTFKKSIREKSTYQKPDCQNINQILLVILGPGILFGGWPFLLVFIRTYQESGLFKEVFAKPNL
jgi:hypothetical protein